MRQVAVLGLGHDFRGDDRAGLLAARALAEQNLPGVTILTEIGDTMDLLHGWTTASHVFVLDCYLSSIPEVLRLDLLQTPIAEIPLRTSSHFLNLREALEMGRNLDQLPSQLIAYAIPGNQFAFGQAVQPQVMDCVEQTVARVKSEIQHLLGEEAHA